MSIPLVITPVAELPRERLEEMEAAAHEIRECYRVLEKSDFNIVGECIKSEETFYEFDHYPSGDIYDSDSHSQYYYHAHRGLAGEHGHFHTFLRKKGMPEGVAPVPYDGKEKWETGDDMLSHLIAISMEPRGYPTGFFAVNRWVTDENMYPAADVVKMLDHFEIDHANPNWPVNRWLTAMFKLFRPQIIGLLEQRDSVIAQWAETHPGKDVYEDRDLEITGEVVISVDRTLKEVKKALGQ